MHTHTHIYPKYPSTAFQESENNTKTHVLNETVQFFSSTTL